MVTNFAFAALPVLIGIAITAGGFFVIHTFLKGVKPWIAAVLSAMIVPSMVGSLAIVFLLSPNPDHRDGPGMGFAACLMSEIYALPLSILTSATIFFFSRRSRPYRP